MPLYLSAPGLTKRQARVLCAVAWLTAECGQPPTFREVLMHLGYRSLNSLYGSERGKRNGFLTVLERKGYLTWKRGAGRTLRLTRPLQWIETEETP